MNKLIYALFGVIILITGCAGAEKTETDTDTTPTEETTAVSQTEETTETEETTVQTIKRPEYNKDDKLIALTFDDGPNITTTNSVIDKLEEYEIVASFFLIGDNINGNENEGSFRAVKRAFDLGCEINSHSKTHSNMTEFTAEEIIEEMDYTADKIEEITGKRPAFFRPPYIAVNDTMIQSIDIPFIAGYGANDWEDSVSAEERAEKVISQAKDGAIILLHDMQGNTKTVEALDTIIPTLKEEGYGFVTVSELFEIKEITPQKGIIYSYADQTTPYA